MSKNIKKSLFFWIISGLFIFMPLASGSVKNEFLIPVILVIGLLVWLWLCDTCAHKETFKPTPLDKPLAILTFLAVISFIFSINKHESFYSLLRLAGFTGFYYLIVNTADDTMERRWINLVITLATALSITGLLQYFDFLPHPWWNPRKFLAASYVNHNHFAGYLEMAIPLALGLFFEQKKTATFPKTGLALGLFIMIIALIFTQSRGAWLSLGVSLVMMIIFLIKNRSAKREGALVYLFLLLLIIFLVSMNLPLINQRLDAAQALDGGDLSWQTRLKIWKGALAMIKDHAWTGTGIGTFALGFPRFRPEGLTSIANFAHNDYLNLAAEAGIFAPIILLGIFLYIIAKGFSKKDSQPVILGCATGILSLALHGFVDFNFHIPANMLLCVILAALIARPPDKPLTGDGHA